MPMSSLRLLLLHFLALSVAVSVSGHGGGDSGDAGGEHRDLRSGSLVRTKIWCLIVVFFGTFAGGVSPYFLKWNERFLELGTQFAGGVFLGTALMHFLSDSNETFGDLTDKEYPFAFMLACAGYLLTMLADCTLSSASTHPTNRSADPEVQGVVQTGKFSESGQQPAASHCQVLRGTHATTTSLGDSILLIMALCFHSVFEGIAIGVAETEGDAWRALWTVCLHKIFAAIAMGIALLQIIPDRPLLSCAAYAFAFAISSPIGVAIGIIIDATTQGVVADWIFAISMGLACGVFIYVCINHLLSKVHLPQKTAAAGAPLHRFLAVLLGVGVIAVVMIWDT